MSTSEPQLIKLKNAGENVTLQVQSCAPMKMGNYPEVEIVGIHSTSGHLMAVRMPEKSAIRQFERLGMEYKDSIGKWMTISRDPNRADPLKAFWGLTLASGTFGTQVPTPSISVPPRASQTARPTVQVYREPDADGATLAFRSETGGPPEDQEEPASLRNPKLDDILVLHERCFMHAIQLAELAKTRGVAMDPASISALTAQAYISASQRGY